MKILTFICACMVGTCAVSSFSVDFTDPEVGVTVGATYSSKSGLGGHVVVEATK